MKRRIGLLIAVLWPAVTASAVAAQEARMTASALPANPRAEQLKRAAEALYDRPHQLHRAAELHEQEAARRNEADPQRVDALDRAARLYAYAGEPERGQELMGRAARQALKRGDVRRAAHAFIDAAFIALRSRDVRTADDFTREADLLALSPLLSQDEKLAIVRRIDPARAQLRAMGQ